MQINMSFKELTSTKRKILEILADKKESDVSELAALVGIKTSTVKKYASELEKLGLVTKMGNKVKITDKGLALFMETEKIEEEKHQPREDVEAKPTREMVEPFYFVVQGQVVPLRVFSTKQLAAIVVYRIVSPEELSYVIKNGYLTAWVRTVLRDASLAEKLEGLQGLESPQLFDEAAKILREYVE